MPYSNYDGTIIMNKSNIISVRSYDELLNITKGSYIKPHKDCSLSIICPSNQSSGNIGENTYTTVTADVDVLETSYIFMKQCNSQCHSSGLDIDPNGELGDCNTNYFYQLKKDLLDSDNSKLLMKHRMIEQMIEKNANDLLNRRLNLLTIWSTIFLPLSFYTGLFGMNFDDIPFLNNHHGFWILTVLSIVTIIVMYRFFKKNKWV